MPDDAAAIAAIYAPYVTDSFASFEETPPTADEMRARMASSPRLPWLVAVDGDDVTGYAYGSQHRARRGYRWSVECSIYLADGRQRRGTGRRLYAPLLAELRRLGYTMAFAGITLPNVASIAFHEAMGFRPIGVFPSVGFKQGGWRDVGWWQLQLGDLGANPPEPQEWDSGR